MKDIFIMFRFSGTAYGFSNAGAVMAGIAASMTAGFLTPNVCCKFNIVLQKERKSTFDKKKNIMI